MLPMTQPWLATMLMCNMLTADSLRLQLAGVIERSVLHMLLGSGADSGARDEAAWVPRPDMLAAAVGLPPHALPGPDARMFVEQAVLAVLCSPCNMNLVGTCLLCVQPPERSACYHAITTRSS